MYAVLALCAGPAQAQDRATTASELYQRGRDDMQAGRLKKACPALAKSHELDPRPETLFTLAECENKAGRIGSAARHYRDYLRYYSMLTPDLQAQQKGRDAICLEALKAIEPKVPKLTLVLPPEAPPATVVKRDGKAVDRSALGRPVLVDPGEHVVTVQPPDQPEHEMRVTLGLSESRRVVLELAPSTSNDSAPVAEPAPEEPPEGGSALRTAGLVVGGVGLAAVVAGAITGGLAMAEYGTAEDNCNGTVCNEDGLDAIDRTRPLGNASTALFVVGGAGLAAGVLMFVLAPSEPSEETTATGRLVLQPWAGNTSEGGPVVGLRGGW